MEPEPLACECEACVLPFYHDSFLDKLFWCFFHRPYFFCYLPHIRVPFFLSKFEDFVESFTLCWAMTAMYVFYLPNYMQFHSLPTATCQVCVLSRYLIIQSKDTISFLNFNVHALYWYSVFMLINEKCTNFPLAQILSCTIM